MADRDVEIRIKLATAEGIKNLQALGVSVERVEGTTRKTGTALDQATQKSRVLGNVGSEALSRMGVAGDGLLSVLQKGALVAGAGALVGAVAAGTRAGAEMEQQAADLSAITGIAGADLRRLEGTAIEASIRTGRAATDQLEAYKLLSSSVNLTTDELEAMGEQVVTLAVASGVELATAADVAANTMNQFGLDASESGRVVNVLAAGAKEGAAEVEDLGEALRTGGSFAAAAGVSLEETVGALEVLAQNAQKGATAGTGLGAVILRLQTESDKLAAHGLSGVNIEADGLTATLDKLTPVMGDMAALADIVGAEHAGLLSILIRNRAAVAEMTDAVTDTNTAYEQAEVQTSTLRGDLDQLRQALVALTLDGTGGLNDSLRELVDELTSTLVWLHENWDAVETGAKIVTVLVVAMKAQAFWAATAAQRLGLMAAATTLAGNASGALAAKTMLARNATVAFGTAIRANPIGLLVTAIGLGVVAFSALKSKTEEETTAIREQRGEVEALRESLSTLGADAAQARARAAGQAAADVQAEIDAIDREVLATGRRLREDLNTEMAPGRILEAIQDRIQAGHVRARLRDLMERRRTLQPLLEEQRQLEREADERARQAQADADALTPVAPPRTSSASTSSSTNSSDTTDGGDRSKTRTTELRRQAEDAATATTAAARRADAEIAEIDRRSVERRTETEVEKRTLAETTYQAEVAAAEAAHADAVALADRERDRKLEDASKIKDADEKAAAQQAARDGHAAAVAEADGEKRVALHRAEVARQQELAALDEARVDRIEQLQERRADAERDLARLQTDREVAALDGIDRELTEASVAYSRRKADARRAYQETVEAAEEAGRTEMEMAEVRATAEAELDADLAAARMDHDAAVHEAHERQMEDRKRAIAEGIQMARQALSQLVGFLAAGRAAAEQRAQEEMEADRDRQDAEHERRVEQAEAAVEATEEGTAQREQAERHLQTVRQQIDDERAALDREHRDDEKKLARESALAERKRVLFQIAIETALNVVESFPNVAKIIAAGALGVAQGAVVLRQPIPAYAVGTDRHAGGLALVGERGPEIVDLPRGSSVLTNANSQRLADAVLGLDRAAAVAPAPVVQVVVERQADPELRRLVEGLRADVQGQTATLAAETVAVGQAVREIPPVAVGDHQIYEANLRGTTTASEMGLGRPY